MTLIRLFSCHKSLGLSRVLRASALRCSYLLLLGVQGRCSQPSWCTLSIQCLDNISRNIISPGRIPLDIIPPGMLPPEIILSEENHPDIVPGKISLDKIHPDIYTTPRVFFPGVLHIISLFYYDYPPYICISTLQCRISKALPNPVL